MRRYSFYVAFIYVLLVWGSLAVAGIQDNAPWHLDRLDERDRPLDGKYKYDDNGGGQRVFVVDSGIDASNSEFSGADGKSRVTAYFDPYGGNGSDSNGHGTNVAALVAGRTKGVAKDIEIVNVKVMDAECRVDRQYLSSALDWIRARARAGDVVNMSFAPLGLTEDEKNEIYGKINTLIENKNVTVVTSAGNDGSDRCDEKTIQSDQRIPGLINVGATAINDSLWSDSNYGQCVDILAPGHDVEVPNPNACEASPLPPCEYKCIPQKKDAAGTVDSGTSYAAPLVAAAAALYIKDTGVTNPYEVRQALIDMSSKGKIDLNGKIDTPNRLLYIPYDNDKPARPTLTVTYGGCSGYYANYFITMSTSTSGIDRWVAKAKVSSYSGGGSWSTVHSGSQSSFSMTVPAYYYFQIKAKAIKNDDHSEFSQIYYGRAPSCSGGGVPIQ